MRFVREDGTTLDDGSALPLSSVERIALGGNANPFVTVKASGEVENEAGDSLESNVIVTCKPGGT